MYGQPPYYNPVMQNAQQRLQMMEAQYPQLASPSTTPYQQQNPYQAAVNQNSPSLMIKGRPVSNEEEANAAMIDFDGSLFIFPDKAHGKIYTKQLGLDGNIIFNRYSLESPQSPQRQEYPNPGTDFVSKEDLAGELSSIKDRITQLEGLMKKSNTKQGAKE